MLPSTVCTTTMYSQSKEKDTVGICVCMCMSVCVQQSVYQVSDPGGWQQRGSGVLFQAAAGERSPAEVTLRDPAPSSPPPSPSSSSDLGLARIGTAARPHDNGALLIIGGDGVLAQVMRAKMYSPPVVRGAVQALGHAGLSRRR